MGKNGILPIKLPFRPSSTDRTMAQWCGEVVDALQQLRDRTPQGGGSGITLSGTRQRTPPLYLTTARPGHIAAPETGPATGYRRYWLTMGAVNGVRLSNFDEPVDVPEDEDLYIFVKAAFNGSANSLTVTDAELVTASTFDGQVTPDWGSNGARPGYAVKQIGQWHENIMSKSGAGNIQVVEVLTGIQQGAVYGESKMIKQFYWSRENYA